MSTIFGGLRSALERGLDLACRPLIRRVDAQVERLLETRLSTELEARLVPTLSATLEATAQTLCRLDALMAQTSRSTQETGDALSALLDEVNRLREQVEALQQGDPGLDAVGQGRGRAELAVLDHDGDCDRFEDEAVTERARVG